MAPWRGTHYVSLIILICLLLIDVSYCARNRVPFRYSECILDYSVGIGRDSVTQAAPTIPNHAIWATTSSNDKRMPWMARLDEPTGAWTASVQNKGQYLAIDFGKEYIVTQVMTQGRQGSDEYVTEFVLEFSSDNKTWTEYTNEFGTTEIFSGNDDGNKVKRNPLLYPFIGRYIRFKPQRWNQFISMRVDVYGCQYTSDAIKVSNAGYISYNLINLNSTRSEQDLIMMRFRTTKQDGVLFYADGNQGDFLVLELRYGYLHFRIDLGSTKKVPGLTERVGGSMLDDGQWHDIIIIRNKKNVKLVVDRLETEFETNGLFFKLDLDKMIYLGGVDSFNKKGLKTQYNFHGCIDFVRFNGIHLIRDAKSSSQNFQRGRFGIHGAVEFRCQLVTDIPCTYSSLESYILVHSQQGGVVRAKFQFRTHDEDGLILYHSMNDPAEVRVRIDRYGFIAYKVVSETGQVVEDVVRNIDLESPTQAFTDGLWHQFSMYIDSTKVNVTVDRNSKVSMRDMGISSGTDYYLGGSTLYSGFRGCMRNIEVGAVPVDLETVPNSEKHLVTIGACRIKDRCTPNPCEHGGICSQDWHNFFCDCESTGYKGQVCHVSSYPLSCEMYSMYAIMDGQVKATIDPDGSGELEPFSVVCNGKTDSDLPVETWIEHNSMNLITVDGFQAPMYYTRKIVYDTDIAGLTEVIERSVHCQQEVLYKCNNSRLMMQAETGQDGIQRTYGYWVGRTYQDMHYWGGSAPGTYKCACGLTEQGCQSGSTTCECDSGLATSDSGLLIHKDYLPVIELHFGDTGSLTDNKVGQHQVKELRCSGDKLLDNVITFRKTDATLEFPTFEGDRAGDIWFQFKTTAANGVFIHDTGDTENDFIQIRMINTKIIQFRYNVGNGIQVLEYKNNNPLNNNLWHTVHVERNRKQAWLQVDNNPEVVRDEPQDEITRLLDLTKPLTVGAAVDHRDGYVGCMRSLRVNGVLMDMRGQLERGKVTYGVAIGCIGKCTSNPCFNQGTCREGYDHYKCDCAYTPFRGWNCYREVGVNMQTNFMIQYTFDKTQGLSATDFTYIRVGFITKKKQGILIQLRDEKNIEYISLEMNNNGGVKFFLDVGFERWELNTDINNIDLANGQAHEVIMRRENRGRDVYLQVDNYEAASDRLGTKLSDSILDDPKYLFIGNNDTENTQKGFEGCIYRVQIDNIFPLKRAFQDPRPDYIRPIPGGDKIKEDMCGFEEITKKPDPIEIRPWGPTYVNLTLPPPPEDRHQETQIIVAVPQDNTTTAAAPVQTRSDIECHPDSISVHLPQNLLPGGQNVTWREEACSVAFNVTHYTDTIQLTDCGTTVQLGDQTVIFSNDLIVHKAGSMSQHNSNADITFGDGYDSIIPVQCIYPRQNNLTSSYAPIKQHVRFMERRHGQLELSLEQYKTAQYKTLIPSNGHPRSVPLNDDIYMRVGLTLPGKDLRVKVDQCIATSTPSPLDANWLHLINSSCPVSPTQLLSSSVSQDVKFSFKAFDFRHSSSGFIYIHCEVTVCSTTDPNCVMSCSKRTRRAASVNPFGGSHLLSAGPFQMAKEDVKGGAVSSAIVFAGACLSLALISVGVAILGWTRKSRHSQTFEKL